MPLDDATLAEFQALLEAVLGEPVAADDARAITQRLLTLYDLLLRPLPPGKIDADPR